MWALSPKLCFAADFFALMRSWPRKDLPKPKTCHPQAAEAAEAEAAGEGVAKVAGRVLEEGFEMEMGQNCFLNSFMFFLLFKDF